MSSSSEASKRAEVQEISDPDQTELIACLGEGFAQFLQEQGIKLKLRTIKFPHFVLEEKFFFEIHGHTIQFVLKKLENPEVEFSYSFSSDFHKRDLDMYERTNERDESKLPETMNFLIFLRKMFQSFKKDAPLYMVGVDKARETISNGLIKSAGLTKAQVLG